MSEPQVFTPMSADLISAISSAYADKSSALASRVKVIRRALAAGFTVKTITETMASAAAVNPDITAVGQTIYGHAAAASAAVDATRAPFSTVSTDDLATLSRAAKHVGITPFKTGVKTVLAPLEDAAADVRLLAVVEMSRDALANVRPDRARAKTRAARPNDGTDGDGDTGAADVPNVEHRHPAGKPDAAEALTAIRRATKYLTQGGAVDADMASAFAEFVAAAAAADKRSRVKVAA